MKYVTKRALLLNSDFTPLHFVSDKRAICMSYDGRAEVIDGVSGLPSEWNDIFRSPSTSIKVPATLRLVTKVNKRHRPPKFRKKALFNRDQWQCQYCGVQLHWTTVTVDHILPSSRGGKTSWMNCTTACKPCNKNKGNKTPEEANMSLKTKPSIPTPLHFWDILRTSIWHPDWDMWLKRQ